MTSSEPKPVIRRILSISKWALVLGVSAIVGVGLYVLAFFAFAPSIPDAPRLQPGNDAIRIDVHEFSSIPLFLDGSAVSEQASVDEMRHDFVESPVLVESVTIKLAHDSVPEPVLPAHDLLLSGDANSYTPWNLKGILLVESFSGDQLYSRTVIGDTDGLTDGYGTLITRFGQKTSSFHGGDINLARFLAPGTETHFRIQLLSLGNDAFVSDLYLVNGGK